MFGRTRLTAVIGVFDKLNVLADVGIGTGVLLPEGGRENRVVEEAVPRDECSDGSELVESTESRGWTTAWPEVYIVQVQLNFRIFFESLMIKWFDRERLRKGSDEGR